MSERCITYGSPQLIAGYQSYYEIQQTAHSVIILSEMIHDVRIVRLEATHAPSSVRQWLGDSTGHWEGDTLVVETTNFNDQTAFRGASRDLRVTERFRRVDARTLLYRATMEDPSTFTKSWTMQYPFAAATGPIYEYACHEGNYAMPDILGGARKADGAVSAK